MVAFQMNPLHYTLIFLLSIIIIQTTNAQYSIANQFLAAQNAARFRARLAPLSWDPNLARYAQWWANQRRNDCALIHSNGRYGENIFWGSGTDWTPGQAANAWISEGRYFNLYGNTCANGQQCGHFTQVVWRRTTRVGCARVVCPGGRGVFMICTYDPPGNYYGERPY